MVFVLSNCVNQISLISNISTVTVCFVGAKDSVIISVVKHAKSVRSLCVYMSWSRCSSTAIFVQSSDIEADLNVMCCSGIDDIILVPYLVECI